ncbi:hypothetical protein [Clostridium saccharoperbutylacetonicum]
MSDEKYKKKIIGIDRIAHYSNQSTTDLICLDNKGNVKLVEVEYLLSNIFKHEHPFKTFDYIVCWKIDMEVNERRKLVDGVELKLIKENNFWYLKYGVDKIIPIIVPVDAVNVILKKFNVSFNL